VKDDSETTKIHKKAIADDLVRLGFTFPHWFIEGMYERDLRSLVGRARFARDRALIDQEDDPADPNPIPQQWQTDERLWHAAGNYPAPRFGHPRAVCSEQYCGLDPVSLEETQRIIVEKLTSHPAYARGEQESDVPTCIDDGTKMVQTGPGDWVCATCGSSMMSADRPGSPSQGLFQIIKPPNWQGYNKGQQDKPGYPE
jgi:hypothetical protein